jgi:hypothetical protein
MEKALEKRLAEARQEMEVCFITRLKHMIKLFAAIR